MNPFQPITWEQTLTVPGGAYELQNAINTAANSGLATRIQVTASFTSWSTLKVPAGAVICLESGGANPIQITASWECRIMDVATDADAGDTIVHFSDIHITDGLDCAVHAAGTGNAIIVLRDGAVFSGSTGINGAAIYVEKGAVGIFGASLSNNNAYGKGGAVYVREGYGEGGEAFRMNESTGTSRINLNFAAAAGDAGGAIYVEMPGYPVIIEAGTISDNRAVNGMGGGLYVRNLTMTGGVIEGNIAKADGGGVYLDGPGTINDSSRPVTIGTNTTDASGGGIYMTDAKDTTLDITLNVAIWYNTAKGDGGGIYVPRSKLWDLRVGQNVHFVANTAPVGFAERFPQDDEVYAANILGRNWSADFTQGYNNYDISYSEPPIPDPVDVSLIMTKNAVGGSMAGGEFSFEIEDEGGNTVATGTNNADGLITFTPISFDGIGTYEYTAKEVGGTAGWDLDETTWPVIVTVTLVRDELQAAVTYPNGVPTFVNTKQGEPCGLFEFPGLTFDAPGTYEFTLKEETPSGGGWQTDDRDFRVTVEVIDDGHGNLIATMTFPDGFPSFTNTYTATPAKTIISGTKTAVGAPLPCGKFIFGLYNEAGERISTARNG